MNPPMKWEWELFVAISIDSVRYHNCNDEGSVCM